MPVAVSAKPRTLQELLDAFVQLEQDARSNDDLPGDLALYRWQPVQLDPTGSAHLWHWLASATSAYRDTATMRDTFTLLAVVGIPHTDSGQEQAAMELYGDLVRNVYDKALDPGRALGQAYTWCTRTGMRTVAVEIGGVPVLGLEFTLQCLIDRWVTE